MSANHNHIKKYSLTDIEQYLQGNLSPAEMHEMEKAAVQDPFLADAMEGYQFTDLTKAQKDLADIRLELLKEDPETAPVIQLTPQRKNWLRAAVIILLLTGSSTIAWFVFKSEPQKKEMVQQVKKDSVQTNTALGNQIDSVSESKKDLLATVPPIKKQASSKILLKEKTTSESTESASAIVSSRDILAESRQDTLTDKIALQSSTAMNNPSVALMAKVGGVSANNYKSELLSATLANTTITSVGSLQGITVADNISFGSGNATPLNLLKGRVVDIHNKPIAFATVRADKNSLIAQTDSAGIFTLRVKDSIQKVNIKAIAFEETTAQLKASETNQITLKDASGTLDEVVVVGYQTQKKKDLTGSIGSRKVSPQPNIQPFFKPEIGWDSLMTYLRRKINYDKLDKQIQGDITVKMTVKKEKILDVEIVQSMNNSLNKKLAKALKNGPKWISSDTSENKQTHTIIIRLY